MDLQNTQEGTLLAESTPASVCQGCHKTSLSILSLYILCLLAETTFPASFLLASFTNTGSKCASHKRCQNSAKKHAHKIKKPLSTSSTFRSKERATNLPAWSLILFELRNDRLEHKTGKFLQILTEYLLITNVEKWSCSSSPLQSVQKLNIQVIELKAQES
jgi:hypothetical protein